MKAKTVHTVESFMLSEDGVISDEVVRRYTPSVLPMDRLELSGRLLVMAVKTGRGIKRGDIYSVDYVHRSGGLVVRSREGKLHPGLLPMEFFAEMLEIPADAEPPKA